MKDVVGYEGLYQVTEEGRVFSPSKGTSNPRGKFMKAHLDHCGYPTIILSKNRKKKNHSVHRLVAEAYLKKETDNLQVNHKDGNKLNNNASNLEWCTPSENCVHKYRVLGMRNIYGESHIHAKLNSEKVREIWRMKGIKKIKDIANMFDVSPALIYRIYKGLAWKYI